MALLDQIERGVFEVAFAGYIETDESDSDFEITETVSLTHTISVIRSSIEACRQVVVAPTACDSVRKPDVPSAVLTSTEG